MGATGPRSDEGPAADQPDSHERTGDGYTEDIWGRDVTGAKKTYAHAEAFALMTYRSDDGTEEEVVWNSRDGVTPFVISLRSGKAASHVDWHLDRRVPDYQPPAGSRMFVDLTEERALECARVNAEQWMADPELAAMAREQYGDIETMAHALAAEYLRPGAPDLIEVTG